MANNSTTPDRKGWAITGPVDRLRAWGSDASEDLASLDDGDHLIGSAVGCKIRLDDAKVSRSHAALTRDGATWLVRDLESTNGIRIDGERVLTVELTPGQELGVGPFRLIAESEGESFYRGQLAARIVAHAKANGGLMTGIDLAAHVADWVDPIRIDYRGYEVAEIPPNGQGIAALMALGMMEEFDVKSLGPDNPDYWHLSIEAMKLAFRDVNAQVADPEFMNVPPSAMLDREFLKRRAKLIDMKRAQDFSPSTELRGGTVYLNAADASGMMISFIQSNYMGFGSGVVVDGISLQNRACGFVLDPAHPNCVAGGKRPFHTIIPGFILKDGLPRSAFGVMGGHVQPQGHLQTAMRMIDFGENPQAALDGPRFRVEKGLEVDLEPWTPAAVRESLAQRGHLLKKNNDSYMDFGSGQIIWKTENGYVAGSDCRRDGGAVGF